MNFADFTTSLNNIPFAPRQANARGLIAPLIRSSGHILFLTACLSFAAAAPEGTARVEIMTEAEAIDELNQAFAHVAPANIATDIVLSTRGTELLTLYSGAIGNLIGSYHDWSETDRLTACRNLANRAAALGASLDRELAGLNSDLSDPGSSF